MLSWKEYWSLGAWVLPWLSSSSLGNRVPLALVYSPVKEVSDSTTGNCVLFIHSKGIYWATTMYQAKAKCWWFNNEPNCVFLRGVTCLIDKITIETVLDLDTWGCWVLPCLPAPAFPVHTFSHRAPLGLCSSFASSSCHSRWLSPSQYSYQTLKLECVQHLSNNTTLSFPNSEPLRKKDQSKTDGRPQWLLNYW